jgi:glycine cleavage system transcriptional repressor
MFSLTMSVNIPAATQISDLRERFILFCDDLNLDAIIEPEKT